MSNWMKKLNGDPLPWLLDPDPQNPGVRYFALVDLLDRLPDDPSVCEARQAILESGPVAAILAAQDPQGWWVQPDWGYLPKYTNTPWQIVSLALLGAPGDDPHVRAGCDFTLEHGRCQYGGFTLDGRPTGLIHCLQGNLCMALIELGWLGDLRLDIALDWLARSITGAGIGLTKETPIHYYKSGNCAPGFACSANNGLPCAWGAVKAMLALARIPESRRTPEIKNALRAGVEFLLSRDPALADYPTPFGTKPNRSWFQPGVPIGYVADFFQTLEALLLLGFSGDPRLEHSIDLLLSKQDATGRWKMEYTYNGKTWADIERKGEPSKWVTLRALRILKGYYKEDDKIG